MLLQYWIGETKSINISQFIDISSILLDVYCLGVAGILKYQYHYSYSIIMVILMFMTIKEREKETNRQTEEGREGQRVREREKEREHNVCHGCLDIALLSKKLNKKTPVS